MIVLNKGMDGFLHSLIPVELRETLKPNTATYMRVRALTTMLVATTALSAVSNLLVGGAHLLFFPDMLAHDLVPLGILLLLALQTWLFYKFNNYWISGLAFTNFYFLIIAVLLIISGGYESHGKAILLTCPMTSFLIGGRQEGMQNTVITILFCLTLFFLHSISFDLPNIFSTENPYMIFSVNWVTSISIITVSIMVYETELQKRSQRLKARQDPTRHNISEFSKNLEIFMHQLIPVRLRTTLDPDSMVYTRVQILSAMLVIATILSLLHSVLLVAIHLLSHPDQLKYDWVIVAITACFGLQTWLFHKYNHYVLSGKLLSYFYFIVIVTFVAVSGAYDSPAVVLMLISPVGFFMIGGIRDGILNAVLIAIIGVVLSYMKHRHTEWLNLFQDLNQPITFVIVWSLAVTGLAACMMTYDTEMEKPE